MLETILGCTLSAVLAFLGITVSINMILMGIEERKQAKRNEARELRDIEYHEKRMRDFK